MFSTLVANSCVRCKRCRIGELNVQIKISLILVRDKAGRQPAGEQESRHAEAHEKNNDDGALSKQCSGHADVAIGSPFKHPVEPAKERSQRTPAFCFRLEHQGGQRRAERQRIESRQNHRDGDGHRELLVQPAGDAGDERRGNENRGENQRDPDDRAGQLLHGFECRLFGSEAVFDVAFHSFHHHDRVVNHQTDRQHQSEERERVDGKAEQRKEQERPDQRNRNRQQRNQRRPPTLQKNVHHQNHQTDRDQQGLDDFLDPLAHGERGIDRDSVVHVVGETGFGFRDQFLHPRGRLHRIGPR